MAVKFRNVNYILYQVFQLAKELYDFTGNISG